MDVCLKCELCNGFFGDSGRWPRVLGCGHSICSLCTHLLLKNSAIICPNCNTPYPARSPNMVPLNHTVLKLLGSPFLKNLPNFNNPEDQIKVLTAMVSQKLSPGNSGSQEDCRGPEASQPASPSLKKPEVAAEPTHHAGICDEHGQYLLFWCNRCMEWICRDCTIASHPHSVCPITTIRQTLRDMQAEEDKLIKNTVTHFDENLRLFREKHQLLRRVRNQHINHVKEVQQIISLHRKAERLLEREVAALQEAMSKGLNICSFLLESQGNLLEASSLQEILATRLKAQEYQSAILSWFDQSLLKDSPDFVYSRELQGATEDALATMKQKMALSGHSLTENQSQPALPTTTATPSKGTEKAAAEDVQDVEKLLFDNSADSNVTGWLVLSPTVLHKKGIDEVDEEVSDASDDHDISNVEKCARNLQDQNIDEARKTGAIKKQSERLPVKVKKAKDQGIDHTNYPPDKTMQIISREDFETFRGANESIIVHQVINDMQNTLMNIIGKKEVSVEVKDMIRRSVSIKQNSMLPRQLSAIRPRADIENVEEMKRTILLVASRELGNNVTKYLEEKTASNKEITDESNVVKSSKGVLESTEDVENLTGTENSHTSEMMISQDSEKDKIDKLEHTDSSNKRDFSVRDPFDPSEGRSVANDDTAEPSAKTDEEIGKRKLHDNANEESDFVLTAGEHRSMPNVIVMDQNKDVNTEEENSVMNEESNESNEESSHNKDKSLSSLKEAGDVPNETRELVEVGGSKDNVKKDDCEDSKDNPDIKKGGDICKQQ